MNQSEAFNKKSYDPALSLNSKSLGVEKTLDRGEKKKEKDLQELKSAFIKFAGTRIKTISTNIDTARSKQAVEQLIIERLCGKVIPSNATVKVHRNGRVLTNYKEV